MKMRQLVLYIVLFTWIMNHAVAAQGFEERIYEGYISGEMADWQREMDEMEQVWESTGSHEPRLKWMREKVYPEFLNRVYR
jgi:hypothetical protein